MAYFAQIDKTNTVIDVIAVSNESVNNLPFPESEPIGQEFIASLNLEGQWLQTSYNANFRGMYAGIGFIFNSELGPYGEFYDPTPPPEPEPITEP